MLSIRIVQYCILDGYVVGDCKSLVRMRSIIKCYYFLMKDLIDNDQLMETLFDGVVVVDLKVGLHFGIRLAERITGYLADKVIGKHIQNQPAKHLSEDGRELPDGLIAVISTINGTVICTNLLPISDIMKDTVFDYLKDDAGI